MNKLFLRRFAIAISLAIVFGLLCVYLASGSNPGIWWTPAMWSILFNRFLIGIIVAVVWVHTVHPVFGFTVKPFLRWTVFWTLVSIDLAIGVFVGNVPNAIFVFWATIIAWAVYGMIIDMMATKFAWEGTAILGKK